jgi:hypothetical protein
MSGDLTDESWRPIKPEHYALYEQAMERARALFDDKRDDVAAVADDSFQMADEALALWGTIDTLKRIAEQQKVDNALLRRGIEDAIHTLTHLMKQSGKPDHSEIVSRVVQIVVPRLHQVLAGGTHMKRPMQKHATSPTSEQSPND